MQRSSAVIACLFSGMILCPGNESAQARKRSLPEFDLIGMSLAAAQGAYERGEWGAVRSWSALAVASVERSSAPAVSGRHAGNAAQLLDVLQLYDCFARGLEAERDARVDSLVASLFEIEVDLGSALARRHGGRKLDYDAWTNQIVRFGDLAIDYDPWTRMPRRIGPVEITYDPFDDFPRSIAGIDIR